MGVDAASGYLRGLAAAIEGIEATNRNGASLPLDEAAAKVVEMLLGVRRANGKILLIGNGGSAGVVSHVHNDLCCGVGVRALVFNDAPLFSALANDYGAQAVFDVPVRLWVEPGDLLFAVSSSGESENVLRAARVAVGRQCHLVTFTGFAARNPLRVMGDINFYVPSGSYGYVESAHACLAHFLTDRAATLAAALTTGVVRQAARG